MKFNFLNCGYTPHLGKLLYCAGLRKYFSKEPYLIVKKKKNPTHPPPFLTTNSFYQLLWFFWRRWLQFESDYVPQLQLKFQSLHICFIYHHTEKLSYKSNFLFIGPKQRIRNNVSIEKEKSRLKWSSCGAAFNFEKSYCDTS